ncbi:MAG: tetratricopeptide repeat protein, partial [Nitrososphaeraceae archaeon]
NLAMKKGNVRGTYNLGLIYHNRNSSLEDRIIAFKCFETAALQNCYRSQNFLAYYYYNGIGVPTSYSIAYFWITISRTTVENDISNNNGKHYKKTRKEIRQNFRIMEEKMKSTIGPEKIIDIQRTIKNEFFDYKKMKFKLKPDNVKAEIRYL